MNFENLKTSLELNSEAEPTIELALRLSHLLFKDIAAEAGAADIMDCPAGKPGKFLKALMRQCYITENICGGNAGLIEAYREEVEGYLSAVRETEAELRNLEAQMKDWENLEEIVRGQEKKIADAKERKKSYDAMQKTKKELEEELGELKTYDSSGLQADIDTLTAERDRLLLEKNSTKKQKENLETEIGELTSAKNRLTEEISDLIREFANHEKTLRQKTEYAEKWRSDKKELEKKINEAVEALGKSVDEYTDEKKKYDSLINEKIPAQTALIEELKKTAGEQNTKLETLETELKTLNETKDAQDREIVERTEKEEVLKKELEQLKNEIVSRDESVAKLQQEVNDLKSKNDAQRLEQLEEDLENERKALIAVGEQCEDLVAEVAKTDAEIKRKEAEYAKLSNQHDEQKRRMEKQKELSGRIGEAMKGLAALLGTEEEIQSKLEHCEKELEFLNGRRKKLCLSIEKMAQYLGVKPEDGPEGEVYQRLQEKNVSEISERLKDLRQCLCEAAASLRKP